MEDGPPRRVVVHRPEPPPDSGLDVVARAPPKPLALSKDEVRALLAVNETTRPRTASPWRRVVKRLVVGFVGTTLLSWIAQSMFGWWSVPILVIAAVTWVSLPLWRQGRDGWT